MEGRKEKIKRAADRRPMRDFSWRGGLAQSPEEKNNRRFFYIAAGSILVALVAFLCGVQMGKSFSELRRSEEPGSPSRVQDRKGQPPPFRLMERGKEIQPSQEARLRNSDPGDRPGEREGATPQPNSKVSNGKASGSAKDSASPSPEEEGVAPPKAKYALQVAAFNNPTEAQDLISQLKKKGYNAYQVTGSGAAKGTLHRVRIGNFQSLQEAREFALAFEKKESMKPIISSLQNP